MYVWHILWVDPQGLVGDKGDVRGLVSHREGAGDGDRLHILQCGGEQRAHQAGLRAHQGGAAAATEWKLRHLIALHCAPKSF